MWPYTYRQGGWQSELTTDYSTVTRPAFGKVVLFLRPDNLPVHAAVYVADEVVFAKNGGNDRQPWMLTQLDR